MMNVATMLKIHVTATAANLAFDHGAAFDQAKLCTRRAVECADVPRRREWRRRR